MAGFGAHLATEASRSLLIAIGGLMTTFDNDTTPHMDYETLVEEALRNVVRAALKVAERDGLPGEAHFYITFLTEYDGVNIPQRLKKDNPEKMTIILQHQFWDLVVGDDAFSVALSFGGERENLVIPFMALTEFVDPSCSFSLQFDFDLEENYSFVDDGKIAEPKKDKPPSAEIISLAQYLRKR